MAYGKHGRKYSRVIGHHFYEFITLCFWRRSRCKNQIWAIYHRSQGIIFTKLSLKKSDLRKSQILVTLCRIGLNRSDQNCKFPCLCIHRHFYLALIQTTQTNFLIWRKKVLRFGYYQLSLGWKPFIITPVHTVAVKIDAKSLLVAEGAFQTWFWQIIGPLNFTAWKWVNFGVKYLTLLLAQWIDMEAGKITHWAHVGAWSPYLRLILDYWFYRIMRDAWFLFYNDSMSTHWAIRRVTTFR